MLIVNSNLLQLSVADTTEFLSTQSTTHTMLSLSPKHQSPMGELNSARGKELARRNITNSNDASFIRSRTYKRIRNRSMGKKRKENLDNRYLPMPLFPGRQPSKSKMKQKHFQFNKPKVPLLYTRGMERKKKCASSNLARRESLVQRSHSPIYFNVSTPTNCSIRRFRVCFLMATALFVGRTQAIILAVYLSLVAIWLAPHWTMDIYLVFGVWLVGLLFV